MDGKGFMLCKELSLNEDRRVLKNWFPVIAPHPEEASVLVLYSYSKLMKYDTNLLWGFIKNNRLYIKKVVVFCPEMTKTAEDMVINLKQDMMIGYNIDIDVELYLQPEMVRYS